MVRRGSRTAPQAHAARYCSRSKRRDHRRRADWYRNGRSGSSDSWKRQQADYIHTTFQEIFSQHPGKKITLIHRQTRLLDDRFPKKLSKQLEALCRKHGVELVLGDEHIQEADLVTGKQDGMRTIRTKNGKEIKGECSYRPGYRFVG